VQSFPFDLEDPSLFLLFGIANFGKSPKDIEASIQDEIQKVKDSLITDNELTKIRNEEETSFIEKNSTEQGKAIELANYHIFFGDTNLINSEIDKFMAVTKEDLRRVANQYLTEKNRTVLYYLPKTKVQ
jgi:predicted Zn-dependent peptidase